jgi:hypothetical protein
VQKIISCTASHATVEIPPKERDRDLPEKIKGRVARDPRGLKKERESPRFAERAANT